MVFSSIYIYVSHFLLKNFYISGHMEAFIYVSQHISSSTNIHLSTSSRSWQCHPTFPGLRPQSPRTMDSWRWKGLGQPPVKILFKRQEGRENQRWKLTSFRRHNMIWDRAGIQPKLTCLPALDNLRDSKCMNGKDRRNWKGKYRSEQINTWCYIAWSVLRVWPTIISC